MTNIKSIINTYIAITLAVAISGCNSTAADQPANLHKNHADILAQTFKTESGWGYAVYVNDKLFIRQSFIPVIEGNRGFVKEADAIKIATLVVDKLKHHEKPTIRLEELQRCGIIKND